jgi:hypothetical protein
VSVLQFLVIMFGPALILAIVGAIALAAGRAKQG